EELGIVMGERDVKAIADMKDSFDTLGLAVRGIATQLMALFAPALKWIADFLTTVLIKAVDVTKLAFKGLVYLVLKIYQVVVDSLAWMVEKLSMLPGLVSDALGAASDLPYIGDSFK